MNKNRVQKKSWSKDVQKNLLVIESFIICNNLTSCLETGYELALMYLKNISYYF